MQYVDMSRLIYNTVAVGYRIHVYYQDRIEHYDIITKSVNYSRFCKNSIQVTLRGRSYVSQDGVVSKKISETSNECKELLRQVDYYYMMELSSGASCR